jgi:hypothetical protein
VSGAYIKYEPVDPFGIDDGELEGIDPKVAFAMGVEWAMVRDQILGRPAELSIQIRETNASRLISVCKRVGRAARTSIVSGFPDYVMLHVGAKVVS